MAFTKRLFKRADRATGVIGSVAAATHTVTQDRTGT